MQAEKKSKFFFSKRWTAAILAVVIFFLYFWLFFAATSPTLPTSEKPICLYSNQCRQDLRQLACQAIKTAKKSIYLQMYALTDKNILKELRKKSKEGVAITLFYDLEASEDLEKHLCKEIFANPVMTDGLMHRKILVVDNKLVFLGTANMTTQSLRMHDNLVIGFFHEKLAQFFQSSQLQDLPFSINGQQAEAWLLPDKEDKALNKLLQIINNSKKNISIAMFTLTHPTLAGALIQARKRGVEVEIAVDYYTAKGASLAALEKLQKEGISLFSSHGLQLLHHKWAFVDDSLLVLGSANWTKAAFSKNQDCFIILSTLTNEQRKFMHKIWKTLKSESNQL